MVTRGYLNGEVLRYVVEIVSVSRLNDEEITRLAFAARRGDRVAMEQFVQATQQDVWRFVAHLSDVQLADDLAQETYLRALGSLSRFEGRSSARTWLLSIARRAAADHVRAAKVRPRKANVVDWQAAAERVHASGSSRFEEHVVLGELITELAPDRREAFVLTQSLGMSYADAAEVCGCPVGTIRSRVARAREDLITSMREVEHPRNGRSAI